MRWSRRSRRCWRRVPTAPRPGGRREASAAPSRLSAMAKTQRKTKRTAKSGKPQRSRPERSASLSRERQVPSATAMPARSRLERVRMPPLRRPVAAAKAAGAGDHNEGKYVYCIIKSGKPIHFGALGMGTDQADVHTVHFKDIAA